MKAVEVIANLHTDNVERAREFFEFLGLSEVGMNRNPSLLRAEPRWTRGQRGQVHDFAVMAESAQALNGT